MIAFARASRKSDVNFALALRNTAALPEQEHEPIHEGRNGSHFAWQRASPIRCKCRLDYGLSSLANVLRRNLRIQKRSRSPRVVPKLVTCYLERIQLRFSPLLSGCNEAPAPRFICMSGKPFRTLERHFSIVLLWFHPE
jgi:hypothetical protein